MSAGLTAGEKRETRLLVEREQTMNRKSNRNRKDSFGDPDRELLHGRIAGAAAAVACASAGTGMILVEAIPSELPGRGSAVPILAAFGLAVVLSVVALLAARRQMHIGPQPVGTEALTVRQIEALNRRLLARGETGRAKILSIRHRDAADGDRQRIIEFQLEVYPIGRNAFTARAAGTAQARVVDRYQTGREVWVKLDPNDRTRVALCQL